MAWLERWNGDGNNCVCENCESQFDIEGYFVGECCPQCAVDVLGPDPEFVGWVVCGTCKFNWFELVPPTDSGQTEPGPFGSDPESTEG